MNPVSSAMFQKLLLWNPGNPVRYSIPLVIFLALVVLLGVGLKLDSHLVPSPLIDKPLPAFSLPDLKKPEDKVNSSDFYGQIVLLNVWSSWCVACRTEQPLLVDLSRQGELIIYGFNYKDERQDALDWLLRYGDPYHASVFDQDGRVGIDLGIYGVPETYIVDRNGVIRYKHIGPITPEVLNNTILPLIRKLEAPSA